MPISATGICRSGRTSRCCIRRTAGFTLLEILVVVVIVGVISTAFLFSVGGGRQNQDQDEALRFAALVRLAGQEAMLRSRELAVEFLPQGYRFMQYQDQAWQPLQDDILRPRVIPEGLFFDVQVEGSDMVISADEAQPVRILFFSTGEMTPFEVTVRPEHGDTEYHIRGGPGGKLNVSEQG